MDGRPARRLSGTPDAPLWRTRRIAFTWSRDVPSSRASRPGRRNRKGSNGDGYAAGRGALTARGHPVGAPHGSVRRRARPRSHRRRHHHRPDGGRPRLRHAARRRGRRLDLVPPPSRPAPDHPGGGALLASRSAGRGEAARARRAVRPHHLHRRHRPAALPQGHRLRGGHPADDVRRRRGDGRLPRLRVEVRGRPVRELGPEELLFTDRTGARADLQDVIYDGLDVDYRDRYPALLHLLNGGAPAHRLYACAMLASWGVPGALRTIAQWASDPAATPWAD